jgi:hypothetical protein
MVEKYGSYVTDVKCTFSWGNGKKINHFKGNDTDKKIILALIFNI